MPLFLQFYVNQFDLISNQIFVANRIDSYSKKDKFYVANLFKIVLSSRAFSEQY